MGENVLSEELLRAAIPQQPATEEVIVSNQPQQPPTGEQAVNVATLNGAAQDKAQYRAAQQEALAQQALQQNMAALANLFTDYSRPSDDIYNETYDNLVMNGIYGDNAHKIASRKASEYSANRLARLQMGMRNDGVTPDGYLTNNGMYYLTQMQGEDPAVASLYAQGYANMPKVAYDRQWDLTKGDHNAARQFQYREQGANADLARRKDYYGWQKEQEMQALAQRADFVARAARAQAYQEAISMKATPEQAQQYAERQGQIAFWSALGGYGQGGRGGNGGNRGGNGTGRNATGSNGSIGSEKAFTALKDITKLYNEAQAEMQPGQPNPYAALYQSALYNYYGEIDTSNPRNLAAWKDYFMKTRGMSSADFDKYVEALEEEANRREKNAETIDKNARLEVNGSHNTEEDEPEADSNGGNEPTEKAENQATDTQERQTHQEEPQYNPSLEDSVVANALGVNDTNDYANERDEAIVNSVTDPIWAEAIRRWTGR